MAPRFLLSGLALLLTCVTVASCGGSAPPGQASTSTLEAATTSGPPGAGGGAPPPTAGCSDRGAGPEPDAAGLRALLRRRSRPLRDCYQRSLKRDAGAGGKATVRFTIGTCGELTEVTVASRRGRVEEAAACAVREMRGWRTPFRPAEPVTVEYPLSFSASM